MKILNINHYKHSIIKFVRNIKDLDTQDIQRLSGTFTTPSGNLVPCNTAVIGPLRKLAVAFRTSVGGGAMCNEGCLMGKINK